MEAHLRPDLSKGFRQDVGASPRCRVPDGRGRHSEDPLRRHLADDRGIATAACCVDSVSRSYVPRSLRLTGEVRLDDGKFGAFDAASGAVRTLSTCCREGFGLSLPVEWCSLSVQLATIWGMSPKRCVMAIISRRAALGGVSALALTRRAKAAFAISTTANTTPAVNTGFSDVPLGGGGFMRSISVNPVDGTILGRTDTAGAWLWNNSTSKWVSVLNNIPMQVYTAANTWMPGTGCFEIASAPSNSSIMYMAYLDSVYKTTNKCASWSTTGFSSVRNQFPANTAFDTVAPKIAIKPNDPTVAIVGLSTRSVYYTLDGGTTWTVIGGIPGSTTVGSGKPGYTIVFDPSDATGTTIYISSYGNGLYKSTTGPNGTFTAISGAPTTISRAKITSTGLYYCGYGATFGGLTQSTPYLAVLSSGTWTVILNNIFTFTGFAVDPNNLSRVVAMSESGTSIISFNGGTTWSSPNGSATTTGPITWNTTGATGYDAYLTDGDLAFDPNSANRCLTADGTGSRAFPVPTSVGWPGGAIAFVNNAMGEESLEVQKVIALPGNRGYIARCSDFPIILFDGTNYPSKVWGNPVFDNGFGTPVSDVVYASDNSGTVIAQLGANSIVSTDWGVNFSPMPNIPNTLQGSVAASTSTNWLYGRYGTGIWYTLNAGTTWTPVSISGAIWAGYSSFTLVADAVTANVFYLFLATNGNRGQGVYKTSDGGATWVQIRSGDIDSSIHFANPGMMWNVPGQAGHLFWGAGPSLTPTPPRLPSFDVNRLNFSNGGASWTPLRAIKGLFAFGSGAPAPSQSYPALYALAYDPTGARFGLYRCINFNPANPTSGTWTLISGSNANFGLVGNLDTAQWVAADPTNYGHVVISTHGQGCIQGYFP